MNDDWSSGLQGFAKLDRLLGDGDYMTSRMMELRMILDSDVTCVKCDRRARVAAEILCEDTETEERRNLLIPLCPRHLLEFVLVALTKGEPRLIEE